MEMSDLDANLSRWDNGSRPKRALGTDTAPRGSVNHRRRSDFGAHVDARDCDAWWWGDEKLARFCIFEEVRMSEFIRAIRLEDLFGTKVLR